MIRDEPAGPVKPPDWPTGLPFNFGGLDDEHAGLEVARIVVLPAPYDFSTTYQGGTRQGREDTQAERLHYGSKFHFFPGGFDGMEADGAFVFGFDFELYPGVVGVEVAQALGGGFDLVLADAADTEQDLALEIGRRDDVDIGQPDCPDARGRKIE